VSADERYWEWEQRQEHDRNQEETMNHIWKVEAEGDVLYIAAGDQAHAQAILFEMIGEMPVSLLHWSEVEQLPEGEELLNG